MQQAIQNQPVEITDLSESGYTPEGVYGHGYLTAESGLDFGWYIYDLPAPNGRVKKVCTLGTTPQPHMDIDFIYYDGVWFKLRSGKFHIKSDGANITPKSYKWKGVIPSKTAFNINRPDLPYRMKILISKIKHGHLSPREYVAGLKRSNPSCFDIPTP